MPTVFNNWIVVGLAFSLWLVSFLLLPVAGDDFYLARTVGAGILPVLASIFMYGLALRSAPLHGRSKVGVHLTWLVIIGLLVPMMWTGMQGTLNAVEPPDGFAVDLAALAALLFGAVIFWTFRLIEIAVRKLQRKQDVA